MQWIQKMKDGQMKGNELLYGRNLKEDYNVYGGCQNNCDRDFHLFQDHIFK